MGRRFIRCVVMKKFLAESALVNLAMIAFFFVAVLGASVSCSEPTREERLLAGSCDFEVLDESLRSPAFDCVVERFRARCEHFDPCMVECFTSGKGVGLRRGEASAL